MLCAEFVELMPFMCDKLSDAEIGLINNWISGVLR